VALLEATVLARESVLQREVRRTLHAHVQLVHDVHLVVSTASTHDHLKLIQQRQQSSVLVTAVYSEREFDKKSSSNYKKRPAHRVGLAVYSTY
jgi:hypothetical protein